MKSTETICWLAFIDSLISDSSTQTCFYPRNFSNSLCNSVSFYFITPNYRIWFVLKKLWPIKLDDWQWNNDFVANFMITTNSHAIWSNLWTNPIDLSIGKNNFKAIPIREIWHCQLSLYHIRFDISQSRRNMLRISVGGWDKTKNNTYKHDMPINWRIFIKDKLKFEIYTLVFAYLLWIRLKCDSKLIFLPSFACQSFDVWLMSEKVSFFANLFWQI